MHSPAVEKIIIADMASKIGMSPTFVADYLKAMNYTGLDLSRSVVGAVVAGKARDVANAVFLDQPLPQFA